MEAKDFFQFPNNQQMKNFRKRNFSFNQKLSFVVKN